MPELPEVETIRRDIEKELVGRRIKAVEATGLRSIRRHGTKKQFVSRLEGRKFTGVERRGKYLLLRLDGGEGTDVLVIHLGMSGQLLYTKGSKDPAPKHTHVAMTLTPAGQLRFVDPRTFGEMFVTTLDEVNSAVPELAHLGFDPFEEAISWGAFGHMLHARGVQLKTLLMDQKFVAGIGNIYSDEILYQAGLRHDRLSNSLSPQEIRRLYRATIEVLQDAVKHRGSSLADQQYRDLYGQVGSYQSEHCVYDREGQACPRCRTPVQRVKVGSRSHFSCPNCQV